ncbi:MAG: SRPBCC domain-containing protein [Tildeniella nuda ZEHNDER 1965/U140]|jgi:uncharacterized protein YndB with AHSA1/START domain|nr:SRPBCC domain-containing protein [Tildeniella nuda ZEHNDER 1965/U140]
MNQTVTLEVFYPHCQERVWQALTDRRALAAWMMDNNFEPRLGHKFHFRQRDGFGLDRCIHCEVIELEPPNRLAYRWQEAQTEDSTIVIWTLTPVSGGTTLQLRHHQPVQTTAITPSVLLQRFGQSAAQTQPRAMFDSIPYGKADDSPTSVIIGESWNDCSRMQPSGSISLVAEPNLELQAHWHHRLIRLEQTLSSDTVSDSAHSRL